MATLANREAYFETGLDVLADLGYGGLKLAEVCNRLGVTTGSFYHYFTSWPVLHPGVGQAFWVQDRTIRLIDALREEVDPQAHRGDHRDRAGATARRGGRHPVVEFGGPDVLAVQREVDQQRFDIPATTRH